MAITARNLRDELELTPSRFERLFDGFNEIIHGVLITLADVPHVDHFDRRLREVYIPINLYLWSEIDKFTIRKALKEAQEDYGSYWNFKLADRNGPVIIVRFIGSIARRKKRVEAMARRYGHNLGPWIEDFRWHAECQNKGCTLTFLMKKGELGDIYSGNEIINSPVQCPYHRK